MIDTKDENSSLDDVMTAEQLLATIATNIGTDVVLIPMEGWMKFVETLHEYDSGDKKESILKILEGLKLPVVPLSLAPKEESRIITPSDMPTGNSKIIH